MYTIICLHPGASCMIYVLLYNVWQIYHSLCVCGCHKVVFFRSIKRSSVCKLLKTIIWPRGWRKHGVELVFLFPICGSQIVIQSQLVVGTRLALNQIKLCCLIVHIYGVQYTVYFPKRYCKSQLVFLFPICGSQIVVQTPIGSGDPIQILIRYLMTHWS